MSDCWAGYKSLEDEGFTHETVNHSTRFMDEETGAHTIESTWRQMKAALHLYNRKTDYIFALADFMFRKKCKAEGCDPFSKFITIVGDTDWEATKDVEPLARSA